MHTFAEAAAGYVENGGEERYLAKLLAHFGDQDVASITPMAVRNAAIEVYPNASPGTRNRQFITPARAVLYFAHEMGWRMPARIKKFKEVRVHTKAPAGRRWLERFIEQCDADELPHLAGLVLFMNLTAARVSEGIALTGEHVDLVRRTALLVKTKTDVNSLRYLPDALVERIRALDPRPGVRVFRYTSRFSVNERIKAVCLRAGLPIKSSHAVGRHSFATNALNAGVGVRIAMDAGGWKSSAVFLEVYAHTYDAGRVVAEKFNAIHYADQH